MGILGTILILGGTTEASDLARLVANAGWQATMSLAGRTRTPAPQPIPVRIGGFGGPEGLAAYLHENRIAAVVDATHPFAAQMTRNAVEAARRTATPLVTIDRPEWQPQDGDRWRIVPDMRQAADAIGPAPRRVLLTVGQQELAPFIAAPNHSYLVRSVERPASLPEGAVFIGARGPYAAADERALLCAHRIEVIVTKNSGGTATWAKLGAARELGIDVVMVERPALPAGIATVATASAAFEWLRSHAGMLRGE